MSELNLTTLEGVMALMESSQTSDEWNNNCDKIKQANKGYPDFWFKEIILSGFAKRVGARWGSDMEIKVKSL